MGVEKVRVNPCRPPRPRPRPRPAPAGHHKQGVGAPSIKSLAGLTVTLILTCPVHTGDQQYRLYIGGGAPCTFKGAIAGGTQPQVVLHGVFSDRLVYASARFRLPLPISELEHETAPPGSERAGSCGSIDDSARPLRVRVHTGFMNYWDMYSLHGSADSHNGTRRCNSIAYNRCTQFGTKSAATVNSLGLSLRCYYAPIHWPGSP
eukprot:scaffold2404_cov398-Prasinococcus_capsulatus_cf.AAC.5